MLNAWQVLEVLVATLFGSAPLSAAADEAFLSLTALAASARDVPQSEAQRCALLTQIRSKWHPICLAAICLPARSTLNGSAFVRNSVRRWPWLLPLA